VNADTPLGTVEYVELGDGPPVLFVHGSPGGSDQGALMGGFLVPAGFRVIAPSRPGYLDTQLTEATATPDQQADLLLALMDSLGIDRFGVTCWSGGGPASYRLAAEHPERVTALVALAAVSKRYEFETGIEYRLLTGRVGKWLVHEMAHHAQKNLIKMSVSEEGDLTKQQVKELTAEVWSDPEKREFVLALSETVAGRKVGLENDQAQFPTLDLHLDEIRTPTLLVHGTADTDVPPEYSEHARSEISGAEMLPVQDGTHLAVFTDPTSDEVQARIARFCAGKARARGA